MNVCRENRELSWLKFNDRVLMQAKDPQVPLAEKTKLYFNLSNKFR